MNRSEASRLAAGLLVATACVLARASAQANTVPVSNLGQSASATTPNILKPADCAGVTVNSLVTGQGVVNGTGQAELVIGSAGADTMDAKNGDDCILGGAGADTINGGGGYDVCIGGPDLDVFLNCEVQIQ